MASATKVVRNFYRDSVALMQLSSRLAKLPGISQASVIMASPANLALLSEAKLIEHAVEAGANDLLIAVQGESGDAIGAAMAEAETALSDRPVLPAGEARRTPPKSLEMGLVTLPAANLALISTPGAYATAEAVKALALGLNVMIFSDNVPTADEVMLKRMAEARGLIVMGPDCGTAIIGGVPLGFANVVRRGAIGVVGASGTGIQQVTALIDRLGGGVSHAIGTGGHDLAREVGAISMLHGLKALAADPKTTAIVLISKPPAPEVAERVLAAARAAGKPVVAAFLGADPAAIAGGAVMAAETLEDAALAAVAIAQGTTAEPSPADAALPAAKPPHRFVRGLYSGGTFCYEAALLLSRALGEVATNTPVGAAQALADPWTSKGHTVVDLGDDVFTRGRPHPMIDHRLRNQRILAEAEDPETAVILLDVVLGYGAHGDPAGEMVPAIEAARAKAGDGLAIVGFVCGTEGDPQGLARQSARLAEAGMLLLPSNAQAVRAAARIIGG